MLSSDQFESIQMQLLLQHDALKSLDLSAFTKTIDDALSLSDVTDEQRMVLEKFRELANKLQEFANVKLGFAVVIEDTSKELS